MADLKSRALKIVSDAQGYLNVRMGAASDATEKAGIQEWQRTLKESALKLAASEPITEAGDLVGKLDQAEHAIQSLHEWTDFAVVSQALGNLNDHVQLMAGPHGPGGGRPRSGSGFAG